MKIITYPDEILRQKAVDIHPDEIGSEEITDLISNMISCLLERNGLGLSACQIGSEKNVCVIRESEYSVIVLINPQIIARSGKYWSRQEGCLSIPGVRKDIKRSKTVKVIFLDKKGEQQTIKIHKIGAAAVQHEIDHLNGVLIIDK